MDQSNIKVVCRFRPLNPAEKKRNSSLCIKFHSDQTLSIQSTSYESQKFTFDKIFDPNSLQSEVYQISAQPIIESVMQGFNGTVFAYGQTSSGKTFTMTGDLSDPSLKGITPRMVSTVFSTIQSSDASIEYSVKTSFFEIYLEKLKDLLAPSKSGLKIREDKTRGVFIDGLSEHYVSTETEVYELMTLGNSNREVARTNMNEGSSRSHSLFLLTVNQTNSKDYSGKVGKLFLVDLAGSEKIGKTGAAGMRLEEAKKINTSLTVLGLVINSLTDGKSNHVPYRDSKLTRVLQDSLGGNSKTSLIVTCSPSQYNELETISSLRFGIRAKAIKNHAKVNREYTIGELRVLLAKAQEECEKKAEVIKKMQEQLRSVGVSVQDLGFEKVEKVDLGDVAAEIEDWKMRIAELAEENKGLREKSERIEKEMSKAVGEKQAAVKTSELAKERVKTLEESLIKTLQLTKEKLESLLEEVNKKKMQLEQELSQKATEILHMKQEIVMNREKKENLTVASLSALLASEREEVQLLQKQNKELELTVNEFLAGSYPEIMKKNEAFLQNKLKAEKDKWAKERNVIMKDLENRIQKVVQLEIEIDYAKDAYRCLEKNMTKSEKKLVQENEGLEKYIGEISRDYQIEMRLREKWRIECECYQQKLEEEVLRSAELRKMVDELAVKQEIMEKKKVEEGEKEFGSTGGRFANAGNIKKSIKGGQVARQPVLNRVPSRKN